MAVGVTQPGGAGTTIMFQTDTSAPNGLYYTEADFAAAFPADFVDLGTTPKSYRAKVSVQNGDGALTGTTTWKGTRSSVFFDTGKTYLVNATGLINRFTEWGTKATGASGDVIGYDGLNVFFGTNPTFNGNFKLYGCKLTNVNAAAATSRIFLTPTAVGAFAEIIDTPIFTLAGTQAFGISNAVGIDVMRRINSVGLGSGAVNGHVVQFNCPDSEDMAFYWPNGDYKISTGGYVRIAEPKFIGPSTQGDTRGTFAMIVLNPEWSQNTGKLTAPSTLEEWFSFGVLVTDANGAPVSGIRIEVYDNYDGRTVVDTTTGTLGTIDFLAPQSVAEFGFGTSPDAPFRNALMIYGHNNDGLTHEHGPFTLFVNRGMGVGLYPEYTQKFSFPYSTYLAGAEKQWSPMYFNVVLPASGTGIATNWVEFAL